MWGSTGTETPLTLSLKGKVRKMIAPSLWTINIHLILYKGSVACHPEHGVVLTGNSETGSWYFIYIFFLYLATDVCSEGLFHGLLTNEEFDIW